MGPCARAEARIAWGLGAAAGLALLLGLWHVARAGAAGAPVLERLAPVAEAWLRAGGILADGLVDATAVLRVPAVVALAAWLGVAFWRRRAPAGALAVAAALLLAWLAQSLLTRSVGIGVLLYALAAAVYLWRRAAPASFEESLPVRVELPAVLLVLALFVLAGLYRLDLHPEVYFDEIAYLKAARMTAGEIEPGPLGRAFAGHLYSLERFQAQIVPHALHVAAISSLGTGILPLRLVSLLCGVLALATAHLALRGPLGPRSALVATGLASAGPVLLGYSRPGFYLAVSILHGALCLGCLLALSERFSVRWSATLGALLGSSLLLYQLSWFVPVFAIGAAATLLPGWWRRPRAVPVALAALAPLLALAAPGAWLLAEGSGELGSQTLGRGILNPGPGPDLAMLLAPGPVDEASLGELRGELESSGLETVPHFGPDGTAALALEGPAERRREALERLESESWRSLFPKRAAWEFPLHMLAQLFHARGWESSGRVMGAPLLNPLLAPLLVLGIAEALRRRREPPMRVLLVWVSLAAIVPATLGGVLPRRTILMFPFAAGLMVLPLRELTRGFRGTPAVAATAAFVLLAVALGHERTFTAWGLPLAASPPTATAAFASGGPASALELARLVRSLPKSEPILMPRTRDARAGDLLDLAGEPRPGPGRGRVQVVAAGIDLASIRRRSCAKQPPFSWIFPVRADLRAREAAVAREFEVEARSAGRLRVVRATTRRPGACARERRRGRADSWPGPRPS